MSFQLGLRVSGFGLQGFGLEFGVRVLGLGLALTWFPVRTAALAPPRVAAVQAGARTLSRRRCATCCLCVSLVAALALVNTTEGALNGREGSKQPQECKLPRSLSIQGVRCPFLGIRGTHGQAAALEAREQPAEAAAVPARSGAVLTVTSDCFCMM